MLNTSSNSTQSKNRKKLNYLRKDHLYNMILILMLIFILKYTHYDFPIVFLLLYLILCSHIMSIFFSIKAFDEKDEHYRYLLETVPFAILIHQEGKIVYANPTAIKLICAGSYDNLVGTLEMNLLHPEYREMENERISKVLKGQTFHSIEKKIITFNKDIIEVEVSNLLVDYNGSPAVMCLFKDITEKIKMEKQIESLAYYDALTNLPNRYMLNKYINDTLMHPNSENREFAVMFIDLDNFKNINDSLGHNAGDLVLRQVANRLKGSIRECDTITRYGGDEFIIILDDINEEIASNIAAKILTKLNIPFRINKHEAFISPSIGISLYPQDGNEIDTLIKNADVAMYLAKEKGKNNFQFFTSQLNDKILRKVQLENNLRKALKNNEFTLYYQPQVDLSTDKIYGLEALIRWKHPILGMISPAEFIPIAEETGLVCSIGEWVLETACKQNKYWQQLGLAKIPVSINVSGIQLKHPDFVQVVKKHLDNTQLNPEYLIIEFTESIMQDTAKSSRIVEELNSLGVKVAIDDFGTGYSSLSLLKNLNIDILKLDSYFINDIDSNPNTLSIINLIIELGEKLNYKIIAEGIETEHQATIMKENNCKIGQGYFFSMPLTADEAKSYIEPFSL